MDRKGKNAAAKGGDLKRYFVPIASSSQSKPNTHEETPNVMPNQAEEQVEEGTENSSNPSTHESDIAHQEQEQEQELEGGQGTSEHVVLEAGGITDFVEYIKLDPRLRIQVDEFAPNVREDVRFAYLKNGPTQPYQHNFPPNRDKRSFLPKWFKQYDWLEYSVDKDKAYCFYCYLFKHIGHEKFGHDVFNKLGYDNWKNVTKAFRKHVGGPCSIHNISRAACDDFKNQKASVKSKVTTYTNESLVKYETRVDTSLGIVSYLALQGEPFRGHDESASSLNKGNFLEMLDWYKERNREVKLAFDELCPKNAKMTSSTIQKILARHCAQAVTKSIKEEMDGCLFSVLIDESRDISVKEQMAVVVRYVNKSGDIIERFLGIQHVPNTTSLALKKALLEVFAKHDLLIARLRGQGYDGASNMRGEFNGLQKLIRDENPNAFYVHCFAHQLQLIVVALSRCCKGLEDFFDDVKEIANLSSSSCRRKDILLDKHKKILLSKIKKGEMPTGRGKNQETSLCRPGDTRWGSHYTTLCRIESMWDAAIEILSIVEYDSRNPTKAGGYVHKMETFSFVFHMKMMLRLLRMTNDVSLLLQKKDQNIVQAISLVTDVRALLVNWRDHGWDSLLEDVKSFCIENEIVIPSRPRIAVPISHQSLVIQILMLMLRRCVDLKSGKLVACPFCPMKKQDFCYNELLNHAIGVGAKHENDEQRKLNEVVRSLVEKHKKEKEAALNKILVLENLLDEKQMLELDLQQLEGNLGVMKHVEVLCQTEKMMNMDELQEKLAAIKHLDELNQTQERMAYDKLQCARKGLIKNDGQSCSFPTEGECSNHTSAVIQGTTSTVPRGVPVTRVSYLSRIKELECRKGWMMVVEVPESLSLQDTTVDPFVVQLGNDGGGTLRQLLKCFEQLWANSLCLRGNITKHNIYFVKESGIFEVHVTPDQIFQIDDAGFKLDTLGIVELLSVFKFTHKRYQSKQYPMYLLELVTELKSAGLDPEYFRNAKKRSLIHNSAVTMTPEQRAQVYTVIIRYWHAISEANLESFLDAMDPKTGLLRDLWLDKVKTAGSILYGRYTFNIGSYIDTYLSLTLYSRCLFEHGPTAKVSERQCEAALYLLNKEQFPRFQKQLLTVYKEVKPNVQTAGGSVVARPTVCPNVATQCLKHDDFGKVQLKFTEDSNQGF
ncbi:hypothetical protein ACQ4PT_030718 [Festuca glaucescens]